MSTNAAIPPAMTVREGGQEGGRCGGGEGGRCGGGVEAGESDSDDRQDEPL